VERSEYHHHVFLSKLTPSFQSSLTLALLRCIPTEGTVYYDGIATEKINLDSLRSRITVIPQTVGVRLVYGDN